MRGEILRRVKVIGRPSSETSCLIVVGRAQPGIARLAGWP
jgi:hypothetical protein